MIMLPSPLVCGNWSCAWKLYYVDARHQQNAAMRNSLTSRPRHHEIDTRTLVLTPLDHPEPILFTRRGGGFSCTPPPSITSGRCHARNSL